MTTYEYWTLDGDFLTTLETDNPDNEAQFVAANFGQHLENVCYEVLEPANW